MSHQTERREKDCLNCSTIVHGRYCHVCGQENIITKESFLGIARHFVYDIFHFDGKFFHTLKFLVLKPGRVAREYCEGKRNSYLHPIRMYLFTSAVSFLIFFSVNDPQILSKSEKKMSWRDRNELAADYRERLKKDRTDSAILNHIILLLTDSSGDVTGADIIFRDPKPFNIGGRRYGSLKEYDSIQSLLPADQKPSWLNRTMSRRALVFNEKYKGRLDEGSRILIQGFLHRLPYMLFLSLPFFALILKLLYVRRKNFYYSDHAIFTLFHYIFSFILLLIFLGISQLQKWTGIGDLDWLMVLLLFYWMGYLLVEMKNFYRQGWIKTVGKFLLLDLLGLIIIIILFFAFLLFSVFEI